MTQMTRLRKVRLVTVDQVPAASTAPLMGSPADVAAIARAILPNDREGFMVAHLDWQNRVRSVELVSVGTLSHTPVSPRETFKAAILANAAHIIVAHNHPSGSTQPSPDDIALTKALVEAGRILDIPVLDHVIVTDKALFSFQAKGLL